MKRCLFPLIIISCLLLSSCALFEREEPLYTPAPLPKVSQALPLQTLWQVKGGRSTTDLALAPTYADQQIFMVNGDDQLAAYSAKQGELVWRTDNQYTFTTTPSVQAGLVIAGTAQGEIVALTSKDGKIVWHTSVGNRILAQPTLARGKVLVKTISGDVFALKINDGKVLWTFNHQEPNLILRRSSAVQTYKDKALVGFADGQMALLDLDNGKLSWQRALASASGVTAVERMIDVDANPVIADESVYTVTYQGQLLSLALWTGHTLWQHSLSSYTGMTFKDQRLFITDTQSHLYAFAGTNGKQQWQQKLLDHRGLTAPSVIANYVLVGDEQGYLHVLSQAKGQEINYVKVSDNPLLAAPLVVGNTVYVTSAAGDLVAYQLS